MQLNSPAFVDGSVLPSAYTCDGENINPPLHITGVPDGAGSLALLVDDSDAPSGHFAHWLLWNMNPTTTEIEEDSVPPGAVEGRNDFGMVGFGGACPPSGEHHYRFRLFALSNRLDLSPVSNARQLLQAMKGRVLEESVLESRYARA